MKISPSGISFEFTIFISVSFENSFPHVVSIGNNNFTLSNVIFAFAFCLSVRLSNFKQEYPTKTSVKILFNALDAFDHL